ncbi:hypothetical protein NL676_020457 [Syzygium grande]|nr:hypothetical protein NL676_020457 [Syzygium grande]
MHREIAANPRIREPEEATGESLPRRLEPAPGTAVSAYAHEAISSVANAGCRRRKTWFGIDGILSLSEGRNGEGRRGRKLGEKARESEGKFRRRD